MRVRVDAVREVTIACGLIAISGACQAG